MNSEGIRRTKASLFVLVSLSAVCIFTPSLKGGQIIFCSKMPSKTQRPRMGYLPSGELVSRPFNRGLPSNASIQPLLLQFRRRLHSLLRQANRGGEKEALRNISSSRMESKQYLHFLQEQFERHRKALRHCGRELQFLPLVYKRLVFDSTHKTAYCPVHKAASRTVIQYMYDMLGYKISNFSKAVHTFQYIFPEPQHFTSNEYIFFTVVRHPFKRLISAYKDQVRRPRYKNRITENREAIIEKFSVDSKTHAAAALKLYPSTLKGMANAAPDMQLVKAPPKPKSWYSRKECSNFNSKMKSPNLTEFSTPRNPKESPEITMPTFKQYILFVLHEILSCYGNPSCILRVEPHIVPASVTCSPCRLQTDLIFKVESINEELAQFNSLIEKGFVSESEKKKRAELLQKALEQFEILHQMNYIGDQKFKSREGDLTYHEYMDQLSDLEIDLLYTAYYWDFQLFGYDPWE